MHYVIIPAPEDRWSWELRTAGGLPICRSTRSYISHEAVSAAIVEIGEGVVNAFISRDDEPDSDPVFFL